MSQKVKERTETLESEKTCQHHWLIESAGGATSRGVCKYCGEERDFFNSWFDYTAMKRGGASNGESDVADVEVAAGSKEKESEKVYAGV